MTQEQAKEILSVYQADLSPEDIPEFAEALQALENDPALKEWFEMEQQWDRRLADTLQGITVPPSLAEEVLEGTLNESEAVAAPKESKVVAPSHWQLWWGSLAALLVVGLALIGYIMFPPAVKFAPGDFASVTKFCDDMAFYANSRFVLGKRTPNYEESRDWLKKKGSPIFEVTPENIAAKRSLGCQTFAWGEAQVSLVCFKNDSNQVVHLFVIDRDVFENMAPPEELQVVQVRHDLETGGWMGEDKLFLLVGSEAEVSIGDLLSSV